MLNGIITKGIGGFYYVDTGNKIYECRARGKFRITNITPLVGDYVQIEENDITSQGYIVDIMQRKNQMIRPAVSNINQVLLVFAAKSPDIDIKLMQKLLIYSEYLRIKPIVCINKIDLDLQKEYQKIINILYSIPCEVILTSTIQGIGIDDLKSVLKDKISVFAGPSGVGKSSLLNSIEPGLSLKIGDLSKKVKRGTHTTRHAELIDIRIGGKVLDTPGFSSFDISMINENDLQYYFPEFQRYNDCRFKSCLHNNEPDCSIKYAVEKGLISDIRYEFYRAFLNDLMSKRRY